MATDEVVKIDKFVKNVSLLYDENDYDSNDNDENEYKYNIQNDTVDNFEDIYNELVEFVVDKSLTLCEKLTLTKLNNFILKEFLY
jgi:hypothetical protein